VTVTEGERLRGRRVLVIEDGPTLTHGGMGYGAGMLAAEAHGAAVVDAQKTAVGSLARMYRDFPHLHRVLPAMGYSPEQIAELEETIRRSDAEFVLDGSPVDLGRLVHVPQPIINVAYDFDDLDHRVADVLAKFLRSVGK
jgi:predicted GTPase